MVGEDGARSRRELARSELGASGCNSRSARFAECRGRARQLHALTAQLHSLFVPAVWRRLPRKVDYPEKDRTLPPTGMGQSLVRNGRAGEQVARSRKAGRRRRGWRLLRLSRLTPSASSQPRPAPVGTNISWHHGLKTSRRHFPAQSLGLNGEWLVASHCARGKVEAERQRREGREPGSLRACNGVSARSARGFEQRPSSCQSAGGPVRLRLPHSEGGREAFSPF